MLIMMMIKDRYILHLHHHLCAMFFAGALPFSIRMNIFLYLCRIRLHLFCPTPDAAAAAPTSHLTRRPLLAAAAAADQLTCGDTSRFGSRLCVFLARVRRSHKRRQLEAIAPLDA